MDKIKAKFRPIRERINEFANKVNARLQAGIARHSRVAPRGMPAFEYRSEQRGVGIPSAPRFSSPTNNSQNARTLPDEPQPGTLSAEDEGLFATRADFDGKHSASIHNGSSHQPGVPRTPLADQKSVVWHGPVPQPQADDNADLVRLPPKDALSTKVLRTIIDRGVPGSHQIHDVKNQPLTLSELPPLAFCMTSPRGMAMGSNVVDAYRNKMNVGAEFTVPMQVAEEGTQYQRRYIAIPDDPSSSASTPLDMNAKVVERDGNRVTLQIDYGASLTEHREILLEDGKDIPYIPSLLQGINPDILMMRMDTDEMAYSKQINQTVIYRGEDMTIQDKVAFSEPEQWVLLDSKGHAHNALLSDISR